jgi:hypothetical protein
LVKIEDNEAESWFVSHVTILFGVAVDPENRIPDHVVEGLLGELPHLLGLRADYFLTIHEDAIEVRSGLEPVEPAVPVHVPETLKSCGRVSRR